MSLFKLLRSYKGELNFTASNIVTAIVSLVTGIIAARYIEPDDLGVIQSVLLIATYASFLHLGVFNGLNRNLAYYKAKNEINRMQQEIDTSHYVSIITAIIGGILGLIFLFYYLLSGKSSIYLYSALLLIATLVLTPLTTHVESTYRSGQQFGSLANIKNFQSAVYFVVSFLPICLGYIGRIIANAVNITIGYFLRAIYTPYRHKSRGDLESFKDLLSAGFPLLLIGYVASIFTAADRTYIAYFLGAKDMGLYTLAGYCITLFSIIPAAMNMLLYPKAATRFGETGDPICLLPFWKKSIMLFCIVLIPLSVAGYFILPYCVEIVMPKYIEGVQAARISLLTCCTYIYMGPGVVFGTLKKNWGYLIATIVILCVFWGVLLFWRDCFTTIESVAWLRAIMSFVLMLFVIIYSYYIIKRSKNKEC